MHWVKLWLRDAAIDLESHNRAAFEELQALREQLRLRARDRVERAYLIHASGDTEEFLDNNSLRGEARQHQPRTK